MQSRQYENLYFQMPRKMVMVHGPGSVGLGKLLSIEMEASGQNYYHFLPQEKLAFSSAAGQETFLNKCYNPDKTQTSYLRFGILPLKWMHKYLFEKPSIIVWVIELGEGKTVEGFDQFRRVHSAIEAYVKKHKIRIVVILKSSQTRFEEDKSLFRSSFDMSNKQLFSSKRENFDDVIKEVGAFIKTFSVKFYANKILKYKDNLTIGNGEQIRFQEYYLRNYIKISLFNLFTMERQKAGKYFEKSYELTVKILYSYVKYAEANTSIDKQSGISRLFYIYQKIEEIKLVSNLIFNWIIFTKMKDKEITLPVAYVKLQNHLIDLSKSNIWSKTNFSGCSNLWKADCFYVFLNFFRSSINANESYSHLLILASIKNLLDIVLDFIDKDKESIGFGISTMEMHSYGLLIEKETYNIPLQTLISINEQAMKHYFNYLHDLNNYKCYQTIASDMLRYDEKYQRTMAVVMISYAQFSRAMSKKQGDSSLFLEPFVFRNFPNARNFVANQMMIENPDKTETFIQKILDGEEKTDPSIIDIALSSKDQSTVKIELDPKEIKIKKIFEKTQLSPYEEINLDLEVEVGKPGLELLADHIHIKFNYDHYDKKFPISQSNFTTSDFSTFIKMSLPLGYFTRFSSEKPLWPTSIVFSRGDLLFIAIDIKIFENFKPECGLRLLKENLLNVACDRQKQVVFNKELRPFNFKFTPSKIGRNMMFDIKNVNMKVKISEESKIVQSFKIYSKNESEAFHSRKISVPNPKPSPAHPSQASESEQLTYVPESVMSENQTTDQEVIEPTEANLEEAEKDEEDPDSETKNTPDDLPTQEKETQNVEEEEVDVTEKMSDYKSYRNKHFELLMSSKSGKADDILVSPLLNEELNKMLILRFKVAAECQLNLDVHVNYLIVSKDDLTVINEEITFPILIHVKIPFSLSPVVQSIEPQYVVRGASGDENNLRVKAGSRHLLSYYLKSNINSIFVKKISFEKGEKTIVFSELASEEEEQLRNNEGTTFSIIFEIKEALSTIYNLGNVSVIWRRKDSDFYSFISFKNQARVEVFQSPFSITLDSPFTAYYFEPLQFSYTITNTSEAETVFQVSMIPYNEGEVLVAGQSRTILKLKQKESKTVCFTLIFNQLGHLRAPYLDIVALGKRYTVQNNAMVVVDYRL